MKNFEDHTLTAAFYYIQNKNRHSKSDCILLLEKVCYHKIARLWLALELLPTKGLGTRQLKLYLLRFLLVLASMNPS